MPYYRHKILEQREKYKPLKCQVLDTGSTLYGWGKGFCLDLSFCSRDLERQYQVCTAAERRWRIQLSTVLSLLLTLASAIYFGVAYSQEIEGSTNTSEMKSSRLLNSLYAASVTAFLLLVVVVISYTIGIHRNLFAASLCVAIVSLLYPLILLYLGTRSWHPASFFFIWACPLLLLYSLLNIPLIVCVLLGIVYSGTFLGYAVLTEMLQSNSILEGIWLTLAMICVNLVGALTKFYEEFSMRRAFFRIGRSLISRQQSLEETMLKEVMIKSVMPPGVCNKILNSGMLHDVVLNKHKEPKMRELPISTMDPVSILFADVVGFTEMSATLTAPELVELLTDLYGRFDCAAEAYNCENISILGDCYFAVSGCPEPDSRHADNCMYTGVGLIKAMKQFCEDRKRRINIRVGIHTGKVLCGIMGGTKFKYDVWSNDAKLANYMESGGIPGRVHVSEKTVSLLNDVWEFEDGFGSKRASALQGTKTFLLKEDFQDNMVVEPIKKNPVESIVFKTIEKKRGSSIGSKEFDGSVPLQTVISQEEVDSGFTLLPIMLPGLTLSGRKSALKKAAEETRYKQIKDTEGQVHVENGTSTMAYKDKEKIQVKVDNEDIILAAQRPWKLQKVFRKVDPLALEGSEGQKVGTSLMLNPITAGFRNTKVDQDYERHGWSRECVPSEPCLHSNGYTFLNYITIWVVAFTILLILTTIIKMPVFVVLEVLLNLVIFVAMILMGLRWRRMPTGVLDKTPYSSISLLMQLILTLSTFLCLIFIANREKNKFWYSQYISVVTVLLMVHFTVYEKSYVIVQCLLLLLTFGGFVAVSLWTDTWDREDEVHLQLFSKVEIMGALCLFMVVICIVWIHAIKSKIRFATLHETAAEYQVTKREEEVTSKLFSTIIPKHVSDKFLTELRYSHSYDHVGVIFADVTNFWEFYEESFEGGMGCIRVLNEIVRDLDDMLSSIDGIKNVDPKWRAIQKIKTVGACYMAASGLDPITEEQTKQGNHQHIVHLMEFSFKILETISQFNGFTFGTNFIMKIGFNYGPVTDGIIGHTKVLYDIWGDTVNLSSRMMSTGIKSRIQCPEKCLEHLRDHFKFTKRGKVIVKGKGEMITYFCMEQLSKDTIDVNLAARDAVGSASS